MQAQAGRETGAGADYCVACHTPFGGDSGEVPPTTGPQISQNTLEGIQCDFCHTLTDPQTYGPSVVKRGQFSDSGSTFHETAYSELLTTSYFCGLCHDQNSPDNNLPLQATYTEWKNSPYATQGIQCQDCHMTPGPGVTKPNPGKAAVGGPDRPHIYTHDFTGGNASELASGEHRQLARRNLQAAATLQLTTPASTTPGSDLEVLVTVNNTGAGHYLPTGVTEIREMWLDVTVIDAGGNTVYQSGAIDENGAVDPRAVMYRTEFRDKDGQPTNKPWLAAGILADHRVPPMGSLTEKYGIPVPADAALPLTVQATLRYRTAPQPLVDDLLGRDELAIPVIDMASARAEVR
jgi:mono/diheme cytochrome c family protein